MSIAEIDECEGGICMSSETVEMLLVPFVLGEGGKAPFSNDPKNAGNDLHSCENYTLDPGKRHTFDVQIKMAIPDGYHGEIKPRSGLAVNHGIDVLAGIIDSGYRGFFKICLINHGEEPYTFEIGERIAQLLIMKHENVAFVETNSLDVTERGEKGFGSSGKTTVYTV
jgi:dUTP pyrophosphatase